jgi:hypothetical protein
VHFVKTPSSTAVAYVKGNRSAHENRNHAAA